ncbi:MULTISPECIES: carbohydrate ABC transporter permease [Rathayibacter]|uniref:ABC transporter permease subunit n=1 Tax=Rathayibacter festucae TaxID=110937 RepID=A0ABX6GY52_9MICO|nr:MULTISPECIES: carbohydrate ABC transporter permease [Rathayibacter]MCJ1705249.1 carbohydrate ABC transporter permease [Rathayibacter sp. VKM Ac-2926]QHC62431.1 ABC transporter permease subunit [Rathayibacter festucae]ROP50506.1 carbohydrate ABC transporter membrane protein 2 (CUT1 family) [Rathayibacter sp. PhB186]ROS53465.1 carbohydrate ABC transporter membrane protein 2 (CUT1 family) [Rathayibacter sp. PhB185]TCL83979.1 carbohydrate ABC transporter membrane protein 2 (CUT1 family) [Rathay
MPPRTPTPTRPPAPAAAPVPARRRSTPAARLRTVLYVVLGTLVSVAFVAPVAWSILRSFQPGAQIVAPAAEQSFSNLTLDNYTGLLGSIGAGTYIVNSLIIALGTAVLSVVVTTLAAYALVLFPFRGSNVAFGLILLTMMVPFQAVLTPLFLEMNALGLTDTHLGIILFYLTFNLPFGVFLMRNSFAQIPREVTEAARIDGAGPFRILFSVLRPMIVPGVATVFLFAFLGAWSDFLGALTFLTRQDLFTLPVAIQNISSGAFGQTDFGYVIAGAVLLMIPCLLLYAAIQKYYVRGLVAGAVKG